MDDLKALKDALEAKEDKDVAEVGDSGRNHPTSVQGKTTTL